MGKKQRAQRWLSQSTIPVVPGLGFRLGGYNYGGSVGRTSSYDEATNRILWQGPLASRHDRRELYHEAAHAFLARYAKEAADRDRLRRLVAPNNKTPWSWGEMPKGQRNPGRTGRNEPFEELLADRLADLSFNRNGHPVLRRFLAELAARQR